MSEWSDYWNPLRSRYAAVLIAMWHEQYPEIEREPTSEELDFFEEDVLDKLTDRE